MSTYSSGLLEDAEARLAPLSEETNLAWWASQVEATEENAARRERAEIAWSDALADREQFARRGGGASDMGRAVTSSVALDLLHDVMLTHQIPDALSARIVELESSVDLRFSRHRGLVGGVEVGDTEIKRILRHSDDPAERREAWEASKTVGAEVADDVRELARLRNEAARSLGSSRLVRARRCRPTSSTRSKLIADARRRRPRDGRAVRALEGRARREPRGRFGCAVSELRPWHHADPFFQETPPEGAVDLEPSSRVTTSSRSRDERSRALVRRGRIMEGSDLYPRDGKNQHAFCIDVDRPATCACSRTPSRRTIRPRRCSTSSATASTTSASATTFPGFCARRISWRPRRRRSSSARSRAGASGSSSSRVSRRGRRARGTARAPRAQPSFSSSRAGCS